MIRVMISERVRVQLWVGVRVRCLGFGYTIFCLSRRRFPERHRAHMVCDLFNLHLPSLAKPYIRRMLQDHLGEKLRFDPENQAAPPRGEGVQLCYKALPDHATRANSPVAIQGVDQLARLYCREFMRNQAVTLATMDSSSLLNILTKASCFPGPVRRAAARVRDDVRNRWAHDPYEAWTREAYTRALDIVADLVVLLPEHSWLVERGAAIKGRDGY